MPRRTSLAWHYAQLGNLHVQMGDLDSAEREYRRGNYVFPGHRMPAWVSHGSRPRAEIRPRLWGAIASCSTKPRHRSWRPRSVTC
ncbi:MAG TPA: hypothetical protein VGJ52_01620 [Vicinamibacterales bacterium]|jgi:hypothetical protein